MSREEILLKKIEHGDRSCLEELITLYYPDIFRYCTWHTESRQAAEDAAQETFLKLVRHFGSRAYGKKLKAYVYKIAANVCIDLWRKKSTQELTDEMPFYERGYEETEDEADFLRHIVGLPQQQQEILILRFSQDLTMREIAEVTGSPLRTVQSRLRRGLKTIEKQLQEGGKTSE